MVKPDIYPFSKIAKISGCIDEKVNELLTRLYENPDLAFDDDIEKLFKQENREFVISYKNFMYSLAEQLVNKFLYVKSSKKKTGMQKKPLFSRLEKKFVVEYSTYDKKTGLSQYNTKEYDLESKINFGDFITKNEDLIETDLPIEAYFDEDNGATLFDVLKNVKDSEFTLMLIPEIRENDRYDVKVHGSKCIYKPAFPKTFQKSRTYKDGQYIENIEMRCKRDGSLAEKLFDCMYDIVDFADVLYEKDIKDYKSLKRNEEEVTNAFLSMIESPGHEPSCTGIRKTKIYTHPREVGDGNAIRMICASEGFSHVTTNYLVQTFHLDEAKDVKFYLKSLNTQKYHNDYESIHVASPFAEIQLRTPEMHEHAENQAANHTSYKERIRRARNMFIKWHKEILPKYRNLSDGLENKPATVLSGLKKVYSEKIDNYI